MVPGPSGVQRGNTPWSGQAHIFVLKKEDEQMVGAPTYVIRPNIRRILVPDTLKTLVLCIVFFFAIKMNLGLFLKYRIINTTVPDYVYYLILFVLGLLFVIELLNTYRKNSAAAYDFYNDRIEFYGPKPWTVYYNQIQQVEPHKNFLDNMFGTGSIALAPKVKIENIAYADQMVNYINQLRGQGGYAGQQ